MPSLGLNFYPFTDPIILTDVLFEQYGGNLANSTEAQRQGAYWLAERQASEDLSTLLAKTIVTGTYSFGTRIMVDHNYVHRVMLARFIDFSEDIYFTITGTSNVYMSLDDSVRGIVDLAAIVRKCQCSYPAWSRLEPYHIQLVYEAGLPSGTVYRPDVLLGLKTYSEIILNEMIGWGNEGPGDVQISEFRNQDYFEKRQGLIQTAFGNSPKANFAWKMLSRLREYRYVGM